MNNSFCEYNILILAICNSKSVLIIHMHDITYICISKYKGLQLLSDISILCYITHETYVTS